MASKFSDDQGVHLVVVITHYAFVSWASGDALGRALARQLTS